MLRPVAVGWHQVCPLGAETPVLGTETVPLDPQPKLPAGLFLDFFQPLFQRLAGEALTGTTVRPVATGTPTALSAASGLNYPVAPAMHTLNGIVLGRLPIAVEAEEPPVSLPCAVNKHAYSVKMSEVCITNEAELALFFTPIPLLAVAGPLSSKPGGATHRNDDRWFTASRRSAVEA